MYIDTHTKVFSSYRRTLAMPSLQTSIKKSLYPLSLSFSDRCCKEVGNKSKPSFSHLDEPHVQAPLPKRRSPR